MSEITDWVSIVIALAALGLTVITLYWTRKQNRLSVKPIGAFEFINTAEKLGIQIWNNGTGPMIIKSVEIAGSENKFEFWPPKSIKDLKGPQSKSMTKNILRSNLGEYAIIAGKSIEILMCEIDPKQSMPEQEKEKEKIRSIIANFRGMRLKYKDIYGVEIFENTDEFKNTFEKKYN